MMMFVMATMLMRTTTMDVAIMVMESDDVVDDNADGDDNDGHTDANDEREDDADADATYSVPMATSLMITVAMTMELRGMH